MEELIDVIKEHKKSNESLGIKEVRINLANNNGGHEYNIYGYEMKVKDYDNGNYESMVNILRCEIETYEGEESTLENGGHVIATISNEMDMFVGVIPCKYYNGYASSEGERTGLLSFENGKIKFFRDATDEGIYGWVIITAGTGMLYKYTGIM